MKSILSLILLSLLGISICQAEQFAVTVRGKPQAVMTKAEVTLADIANISSDNSEALLNISRIKIGNSPNPGKSILISAQNILDTLRNNGVDLNKVGYSFLPNITVSRAGRSLNINEAQAVIESLMMDESADLKLKQVIIPENTQIFTGPATITAQLKNQTASARIYTLQLTNSDSEKLSVDVKAEVESWKYVPVAARNLNAGSTIEAMDFGLARLNTKELTRNIAVAAEQLIGKQIQQSISQGETFKLPGLQKAIDLKSGSRVQMVYKTEGLIATARGITLKDGEVGEIIEVRNDSSKQVVLGRIKDKSTVEVSE